MSRITPVIYQTIIEQLPVNEAAEYFYLSNLLGVDPVIDEEFVNHEANTNHIRNMAIGNLIHTGICKSNPDMNTAIVGISSLKKETIVMVEC